MNEKQKALWHAGILVLATGAGIYNHSRPKKWNKFLTTFYVLTVVVESCCIADHILVSPYNEWKK